MPGGLDLVLFAQPFDASGLETLHLFDDGYHLAAQGRCPGSAALSGETELQGVRLMLLEEKAIACNATRWEPSLISTSNRMTLFAASSAGHPHPMVSERSGHYASC